MTKNWESVEQLFTVLDREFNYLILRNYEQLNQPELFVEGHEDIDILCDDPEPLKKRIGARKQPIYGHFDHYWVTISGKDVELGIRWVGDGYYDPAWAADMLKNKVKFAGIYNVMAPEDYFYSLLYHALFHKNEVSQEYRQRLAAMGEPYGYAASSEAEMEQTIVQFLKAHGYTVSYPVDITIPNKRMVKGRRFDGMVSGRARWTALRWVGLPKRVLRRLHRKFR